MEFNRSYSQLKIYKSKSISDNFIIKDISSINHPKKETIIL